MLHKAIRSLNITHSSSAAEEKIPANASLSLLDLQGLQPESHHKPQQIDDSTLSILIC